MNLPTEPGEYLFFVKWSKPLQEEGDIGYYIVDTLYYRDDDVPDLETSNPNLVLHWWNLPKLNNILLLL